LPKPVTDTLSNEVYALFNDIRLYKEESNPKPVYNERDEIWGDSSRRPAALFSQETDSACGTATMSDNLLLSADD
jgi:hypothetical protein